MRYGVFLRAVNVGGTGKLPMEDLRAMCVDCGFEDVKTYIASGNVALTSTQSPDHIKACLEAALQNYAGKHVPLFVRSAAEIKQMLTDNPFPDGKGNQIAAILLDSDPRAAAVSDINGQNDEQIIAGQTVLYVHYPSGMGRSKLKIAGAVQGSARNMNTIAKMASLTS